MTGRVLGIDWGVRRVGLAITDPLRILARPIDGIEVRSGVDLLDPLRRIVLEEEVAEIVVGLPLRMDGTEGPEARAVRDFAARIAETFRIPVHLEDERRTSVEADRVIREAGARGRERKRIQDSLAARIVLQVFLDRSRAAEEG